MSDDHLFQGSAARPAWSGYWWPMRETAKNLYDDGGPLEKYDRFAVASGLTNPHAKAFERWRNWSDARRERMTGKDASWWGHCNGWAAASVLELEPRSPTEAAGIAFSVGDQKGLLTVCHDGDPTDLIRTIGHHDAHELHALVLQSIGLERRALVCDTALDSLDPSRGDRTAREVWNFPCYRYECRYLERGDGVWDVTMKLWFADDHVDPDFVGTKTWPVDGKPKKYTYRIFGDREQPERGVWIGESALDRPDLVWRPQPLEVQNASEEREPSGGHGSFSLVRRPVVYAILAGRPYTPTEADRELDRQIEPTWIVTEEERAAYPPPLFVGDHWEYEVSQLDSRGGWTKPVLVRMEIAGKGQGSWIYHVGEIARGGEVPIAHVVHVDDKTRLLSWKGKRVNGYEATLKRSPSTGKALRATAPTLWRNSPLRFLMSQAPYAWERAGAQPVERVRVRALGPEPVACRWLPTGAGQQLWLDLTVSTRNGNARGMWVRATLDRLHAELVAFGHGAPITRGARAAGPRNPG